MGKFNIHIMSHLTKEEFRILTAIEIGMRNHEMVPGPLVHQLANIRSGGVSRTLYGLADHRLVSYERGKHCDGYRLTNLGYDYLALKCLLSKNIVKAVGSQFGCGKESDIYLVQDFDDNSRCMKIHRLGRNSFRNVKNKRDYHKHRHIASWLYLSRISAEKEFKFMEILYENGFPVPQPFGYNRHIVIMEEIVGDTLNHIKELDDPGKLYTSLMELILKLAKHGLIHCDFNEFNIMVTDGEPILIDFPQMVSISHPDAEEYFDRDVECVATFFKRRYRFESDDIPDFEDVIREHDLDVEVRASGYDYHEPEAASEDEAVTASEDEEAVTVSEDETLRNVSEGEKLVPDKYNYVSAVENESFVKKGISKKVQKQMEQYEYVTMRRAKLKEEEQRALERGEKSFCASRSYFSFDDASSMCSFTSNSSRAQSGFILGRIKLEAEDRAKKHIPKKALRAKGEANAYNRKRKDNLNTIKEVKEAEFF